MVILWNYLYWPGFVATWILLPFLMDFSMSGAFTLLKRSLYSLKVNLILYGCLGGIFGIALLVLAIEKHLGFDTIAGVCIALGNAYGLICLLILLSFGLVQVPRKIWRKGDRHLSLNWFAYRIYTTRDSLASAKLELGRVMERLRRTAVSYHVDEQAPEAQPHPASYCATCRGAFCYTPNERMCVGSIIRKAGRYYADPQYRSRVAATLPVVAALDAESLVELHEQVVSRIHRYETQRVVYDRLLQKGIKLIDVQEATTSESCRHLKRIEWTGGPVRTGAMWDLYFKMQFYWQLYGAPIFWRLAGLALGIVSCLVVWCELTTFSTSVGSQPDLSVFHLIVLSISSSLGRMIFIFFLILYITICVLYALFRIRLFNYYRMHKCQLTDSRALLFCTAWLCRLIAPLGYNFLLMTHLKQGTAFSQVMHSMDVVPFVGTSFNIYLPCALLPLCLLTLFNVFGRLASLCGIQMYRFDDISRHEEEISRGMDLLRSERQNLLNHASRTGQVYQGPFRANLSSSSTIFSEESMANQQLRLQRYDSFHPESQSWLGDASSKVVSWFQRGAATDPEVIPILGSSSSSSSGSTLARSSLSSSIDYSNPFQPWSDHRHNSDAL
jgi:hypothetical protein